MRMRSVAKALLVLAVLGCAGFYVLTIPSTLPPDASSSLPHVLPLPFNTRRLLGGWKVLFLDGKPFTPDPSKDGQYNRGAYLVEGPGHCAECHSGRNLLCVIKQSHRFAGG